ncbi:MAG TPA: metallophosphoesterase [Chitinophagales bacterium]|nr:metallophosphoesterase [Chitinophagales bacterium]
MHRFIKFYFIVIAIVLLIDFYAFQAVRSALRSFSAAGKWAAYTGYWLFTFITVGIFTSAFIIPFEKWTPEIRMYLISLVMLIYLAKIIIIPILLLEDTGRLLRWITGLFAPPASENQVGASPISRSKFIGQLALITGGVPLAMGIHGMLRNAYNYKIHRVRVGLPHLPDSFKGMKIVQISDIHSGSFVSKASVEKGVEMVNREKPDIVFFTGDLVNYRAEEMLPFIDVFNQIQAKEGVFSIFGNHDYADYIRWSPGQEEEGKAQNRRQLIEIHQKLGWNLLLNENRILRRGNDTLAIIGSENWSSRGFRTYGDMTKACQGCEDATVKLLLTHDPSHWDGEILKKYPDIDITFSGHTHGAQFGVEIPGWFKWSPSQYLYKHWAGLYQEGRQYLYVNRGFGFIGFHGRIGILPEITVMELLKKQA